MKIIFFNSTLRIGGAEKMFYEVIRGLDKNRFQIKVYCLYKPGPIGATLLSEGIDLNHSFMNNKYDLIGAFRLFRRLKKERMDLMCIESSPLTLFWGFICGRMLRVPQVVTIIHSMRKPVWRTRFKSSIVNSIILRRLDRIGVVSRAKRNSLIKEYNLRSEKITLIHNGIDIDRFSNAGDRDGLRQKIGVSEDEIIIGMVGRLVNEKAYDIFLKSAQKIIAQVPESRFLIIGDGRERLNLERLSWHLGIRERVIFLGERQDIPDLISLFDVAVLSSRTESSPVALLEYMASSRPIVTTEAGGNTEIIVNGESGLIVPSEDPDLLATAVVGLLKDAEKAEKMARAARKRVEDNFSLRHMIDKIEKFFLDDTRHHIIMAGPRLDVKGGISSFAGYCLQSKLREGFKLIYHPTTIDGSKVSKVFFFIKGIVVFVVRLISDRRVKIVHIYTASRGSFYRKAVILLLAKVFRKATIFHIEAAGFDLFYDSGHTLRRFCIRKILDISDAIVVLSGSWFLKVSRMTKNKNIKVIPNAVDTAYFRTLSQERDYSKLNILTLGRLEQRKGTYDILDAAPLVLKEMPDVKFYLAGDGDVEKVGKICRERGLEKNVILLGWLDRAGLLKALRDASIFLLPSYHEGLPVAMLEAMASGLAVVSTRVGGIPEVIEEGTNGFLLNPGEKQKLAGRIIRLLGDKHLRERMGKNNIKKTDSMYSLECVVDRLSSEYEYLLRKKENRFTWHIRRLSCMSAQEIIYRTYKYILANLRRFARKDVKLENILLYGILIIPYNRVGSEGCRHPSEGVTAEKCDEKEHFAASEGRSPMNKFRGAERRGNLEGEPLKKADFYFDSARLCEIRKEFSTLFPSRIKDVITEADLICKHRFRIFNLDWDAGEDIDWHKDIVRGEFRFVWELNRHQHLVTLGRAYLLTGDKAYALEAKGQILSWITENPPYRGINWSSPLELAMRLISWCWAYKFIEPARVFSEEERWRFLKSVYLQTEFIKGNLSRYSSANNHLIGEACGLAITGITFPEFRDSKDWISKGKKILFEEILNQVHSDGVTKEQAFGYQGFIMELFLLSAVLFIKNGIVIPEEVLDRFFAMCEFIMNIMDANGNVPHTGDSDNARAIRLSEDRTPNVFKSLLCSAGILSGRGDFKKIGTGFEEEQYWLFGINGFEKFVSINSIRPQLDSRLFREGGYAVFRSGSRNGNESVFVMDCGDLGYKSIAAHGHADLLSVTLSLNGVWLLIDPGTYLYHTGNSWRDYFRGTSAHNTITVNDKNQSEIKGPFMWGKRPVPKIERWETTDEKDCIGVSYRNCSVMHMRTVSFDKRKVAWLIKDSLNAIGQNTVRQYFHLPPGSSVRKLDTNLLEIQKDGVFLYMLLDKRFSVDIKEGGESPIIGWSSDMFGVKVKSPTLVNTAVIEDTAIFDTLLYASKDKINLSPTSLHFQQRQKCKLVDRESGL